MPIIDEETLVRIEEILANASSGTWKAEGNPLFIRNENHERIIQTLSKYDTLAIVYSHNYILGLISEVRRLRTIVEAHGIEP